MISVSKTAAADVGATNADCEVMFAPLNDDHYDHSVRIRGEREWVPSFHTFPFA